MPKYHITNGAGGVSAFGPGARVTINHYISRGPNIQRAIHTTKRPESPYPVYIPAWRRNDGEPWKPYHTSGGGIVLFTGPNQQESLSKARAFIQRVEERK